MKAFEINFKSYSLISSEVSRRRVRLQARALYRDGELAEYCASVKAWDAQVPEVEMDARHIRVAEESHSGAELVRLKVPQKSVAIKSTHCSEDDIKIS